MLITRYEAVRHPPKRWMLILIGILLWWTLRDRYVQDNGFWMQYMTFVNTILHLGTSSGPTPRINIMSKIPFGRRPAWPKANVRWGAIQVRFGGPPKLNLARYWFLSVRVRKGHIPNNMCSGSCSPCRLWPWRIRRIPEYSDGFPVKKPFSRRRITTSKRVYRIRPTISLHGKGGGHSSELVRFQRII